MCIFDYITQILSGQNVYCDGYYGCKDINTDIQADSFVYCDGDYSCKEDKIASGRHTACNGNYACYGATIDAGMWGISTLNKSMQIYIN